MISIGITTFQHRFDKFFVPLLTQIKEYEPNIEVIVAVNGEHNRDFDDQYRRNMLGICARYRNVFPIFFPKFRGVAKLWNTILIHSSNNRVLVLNDDVMIIKSDAIKRRWEFEQKGTFTINGVWSHFLADRAEIAKVGWFDERFLGLGQEDWDFEWTYEKLLGHPVFNLRAEGFKDLAGQDNEYRPFNITCRDGMKYSQFNLDFVHKEKYQSDPVGFPGKFGYPVSLKIENAKQYPYESFYWQRRQEL